MPVLLTTPSLDVPGGVAHYFQTLRKYFNNDVEYFIIGARLVQGNCITSLLRLANDYRLFSKKLRTGNYNLVHLNPSLGNKAIIRDGIFLLIAKMRQKPVIVFFRGWDPDCEKRIRRYFLPLFRFVYSQADAFIVLSQDFKQHLEEMGFKQKVYVETTAVEDTVLSRLKNTLICSTSFNILFLTRIEKSKGIYETLQAYGILKSKYPHITLTIAGTGTELDHAKAYIQTQDIRDVTFVGFVEGENKHTTFERANVYLFPSYTEGMPNSVLEAMAYGLPVVTRPVGGIRDFFENGRMGFIIESLEPRSFAAKLEILLLDPHLQESIREFNHRYAKENFMASSVANRIEKIYEAVLSNATDN